MSLNDVRNRKGCDGMNNNFIEELLKEKKEAERKRIQQEEKQLGESPLLQQLKAELRRKEKEE